MHARIFGTLLLAVALSQCNNYDLLDKLESPGISASGSKETFTSNNYIFVSSWLTAGDMMAAPFPECAAFNGMPRADCACTRSAASRGLRKSSSHSFIAWLSATGNDALCRLQGLATPCSPSGSSPYFNTLGQQVAASVGDFGVNNLSAPIQYDESGNGAGSNLAWTGTSSTGSHSGTSCTDWSIASAGPNATVGDRTAPGGSAAWTNTGTNQGCDTSQRVYCVARP